MKMIGVNNDNLALKIVKLVSTYKVLTIEQVLRFFSKDNEKVKIIINNLIKNKRLYFDEENKVLKPYEHKDIEVDIKLFKSFYILLEFVEKVKHHTVAEYPVSIFFFTNEIYEIIYVRDGDEALIKNILSKEETVANKIIIVEDEKQIQKLRQISKVISFAVVDDNGNVKFYK